MGLMKLHKKELIDIIVSWLTISVAFAWVSFDLLNILDFVSAFIITAIAVGTGFILHELAHKYVAINFGAKAEYRAWTTGLIFALVMALFGWVFAAPGAVYIFGRDIDNKKNGLISLAGPMANVLIAIVFYLLSLVLFPVPVIIETVLKFTVSINIFLALFNLIPIYPLDGSKVFTWNILVWAVVFFPLVFVFLTLRL